MEHEGSPDPPSLDSTPLTQQRCSETRLPRPGRDADCGTAICNTIKRGRGHLRSQLEIPQLLEESASDEPHGFMVVALPLR